jgi:glycosyltransferase involved in cell wall biosynthesis
VIYLPSPTRDQIRTLLQLGVPIIARVQPPFRLARIKGLSLVHVDSVDEAREIAALGVPLERLRILPLVGADPGSSDESSDGSGGTVRIASAGEIDWRREYETVLLAIERLNSNGSTVRYEILGDGPERERVLYTINDLRLTGIAHARGHHEPDQIIRRLARADVFIAAELTDGLREAIKPTLLAMALGLPVIALDGGGLDEVVRHEVEGLIVPPWDVAALAAAIERLRSDRELRCRLGSAARARVETWSVSAFRDMLRSAVHDLLGPLEAVRTDVAKAQR